MILNIVKIESPKKAGFKEYFAGHRCISKTAKRFISETLRIDNNTLLRSADIDNQIETIYYNNNNMALQDLSTQFRKKPNYDNQLDTMYNNILQANSHNFDSKQIELYNKIVMLIRNNNLDINAIKYEEHGNQLIVTFDMHGISNTVLIPIITTQPNILSLGKKQKCTKSINLQNQILNAIINNERDLKINNKPITIMAPITQNNYTLIMNNKVLMISSNFLPTNQEPINHKNPKILYINKSDIKDQYDVTDTKGQDSMLFEEFFNNIANSNTATAES